MAQRRLVGVRIDIETRSGVNLKKSGVYPYVEDPDFDIPLIAYSPIRETEDGKRRPSQPRLLDQGERTQVERFQKLLLNPAIEKHAYNANFERICLSRWTLGARSYIDPLNWHCTAVKANVNGVFGSLDEVAKHLRTPVTKDPVGRRLIRLFTSPDRKTGRFHSTGACWCSADHTDDFALFGDYCKQDVLTEALVSAALPPVPAETQAEYEADQRINDRGIRHFKGLSTEAVRQVKVEQERLMDELGDLTGLDNPNSVKQMGEWLVNHEYPMDSLNKEAREEALDDPLIPDEVAEALVLKGAASLSSVSKHQAALNMRCGDGRLRGTLAFYGAHTGREAGRGIQPQNLPRYEAPDADRLLLLAGNAGPEAPRIAKGTVRASLVPAKGNVFVVLDYNAIEARTLGWACGEIWVIREFADEGKIYEATAATMFGVNKAQLVASLKACGKCGACQACDIRSKGKVSTLALGYQGGAGALVTMGAEKAGIDIGNYAELNKEWKRQGSPGKFHEWERDLHDYPELIRLRDLYRSASPATVSFWKHCARAWDLATAGKGSRFGQHNQFAMIRDGAHNRLVLPSGRSIWYRYAKSHTNPKARDPERIERRTFIGKSQGVGHRRIDTHGGKLTENINQALARDVLFDLIMKVEALGAQGWPGRIVLHVHDEVVIEVPKAHADQVLADVKGLMATPPAWASDLAVKGEGDIMIRYKK